jgi:signal transduction histidine kinase
MSRGEFQYVPWHVALILAAAFSFYLNRQGKHMASTFVLFVLANSFVYVFAAVGRPQDGMFFYFFITNTLSIILVGYRRYMLIILLIAITMALAIAAYLYPASPVPTPRNITPEVERTIFLINLVMSLLFDSYVIVVLLQENSMVETKLIKSNEEATKVNEELDRFVYSASHDMRAPLSSLLGLIGIAEKAETPQETLQCLSMMRGRVHVMDGFIREITDYSRNARMALEVRELSFHECVSSVLNNLLFLSDRDRIAITLSIAPEIKVVTDETRLKVILNNLISNAIKYFDPSKENPVIHIWAGNEQGHFSFSVKDNGRGIGLEHREKIFDMFYRATTAGEGTGLGLYIVSESLQKLNGHITVESEEGMGSTFTVRLPQVLSASC